MVETIDDPQTNYFEPGMMENMMIKTTGSFSGIGVRIAEINGKIVIVDVFEGAPAQEAGLLKEDIILSVDGQPVTNSDQAASLLRGPKDTEVTVEVQRGELSEPLKFTITRSDIETETVYGEVIAPGIGYLQITNFDRQTARDFVEVLAELEQKGLEGLILDLRNNPGGLLDEAIAVAKNIVPKGEIASVINRRGEKLQTFFSDAEPKDYEIVVLVNELSASAAEILAGALQDNDAALLVGQTTYGKATVQQLEIFEDGSGLRYTIAKYRTPSGRVLDGKGLIPDYEVELPEVYYLAFKPLPRELEDGQYSPEELRTLQQMLIEIGYLQNASGILDMTTMEAIRAFAQSRDIDPEDWRTVQLALRIALMETTEGADTQLDFALQLLNERE